MKTLAIQLISAVFLLSMNKAFAEVITLNAEEIQRLGIHFEKVVSTDATTGITLPAQVIHSPNTAANITALYDGVMEQWLVSPGDSVKENQLLGRLRSQSIIDLQNQWLESTTAKEQAKYELDKDSALLEKGIISTQRFNTTQRQYQQAAFTAEATQRSLENAGYSRKELNELKNANKHIGMLYFRAPFAGTFAHRQYQTGDYVSANSQVASLRRDAPPWVSIEVPARIAYQMQIGAKVRCASCKSVLTIRQIDQEIDRRTQTVGVLAEFETQDHHMAGQIVNIIIPPITNGVLIPSSAVVHNQDQTTIYVKTGESIEARIVNLISTGDQYLATDNIKSGEEIVVSGTAILKGIELGLGGGE